jgi:alpha-methylacyl-CoA racemase
MSTQPLSGPLNGLKIIEIAGIGPGPFTSMMLADMGADVVRVERASQVQGADPALPPGDFLNRSRRSIGIDLKSDEGIETLLRLIERADGLVEGFRPGVMERLGIGPEVCLGRNPRLVFGRMTGWGQQGEYASMAGHDINYIALGGVLEHLGRAGEKPTPAINLIGDFGGGGMLLAFGMVCGLLEASRSGQGQVIDAAMIDGASLLMTMIWSFKGMGFWKQERGTNLLDTGAHFYDTYECSDGRFISLGAIEPQFYSELLKLLGLDGDDLPHQMDRERWPETRERFAEVILTKSRAEWEEILGGSDACFAPVLSMDEAVDHPHNRERQAFVEVAGQFQPAPAPRFSRTPGAVSRPPAHAGQHTGEVLGEWLGLNESEVDALRSGGSVR